MANAVKNQTVKEKNNGSQNFAVLTPHGENMNNLLSENEMKCIMDGDYVIVNKGEYAENGEIVVALTSDGATVKTFYKEKGHFRLQPENDEFAPIIVNELMILGRVVASIRFY